MAQKLRKYEEQATAEIKEKEGLGLDYDNTDLFTRIDVLSRYSKYAFLAAEESYGYLPVDLIRDKDGNASALAISELFAFLKSSNSTAVDFLDSIYLKYGYHAEKTENIYFEGVEGRETIKRLTESYRNSPPSTISDIKITGIKDFLQSGHVDEEDENLPLENFLIISLENEFSVAIRPSGTEPKIKYYIFGSEAKGSQDLSESKNRVNQLISTVANWLVEDAKQRAEG
jgi:phosphoglucomutase